MLETATALQKFRQTVWAKFSAWAYFAELCREIRFGEIRINIHDGKLKDLHIALHVREDR